MVHGVNQFLNTPYPPPFSKEHEKLEKIITSQILLF